MSCNKKKCVCQCQELVDDEVAQKRIRKHCVEHCKGSLLEDAANVLLLSYITITTKPNSKTNSFSYNVPSFDEVGKRNGSFALCPHNFSTLFGFTVNKLKTPQKRKTDVSKSVLVQIRKCTQKDTGTRQKVNDDLTAVLETEPRETSHYALNDANKSRRYYYSAGMSIFKFWLKYLDIYGNEDDKKFLKQGKEKNYYNTYHDKQTKKDPGFTDNDPMLSPSILYSKARKYWKRYDIKFQARKCDVCETCYSLRCGMNATTISQEKRAENKQLLFDHQKSARIAIWVRQQWCRFVQTKAFHAEHLCMDYGANPRCPYMEIGRAYYNRILGVNVFIITSPLKEQSYFYMYDEQTAKKGSDEVISLLAMHVKKEVASDMKQLTLHCDGCVGQSWNNRLPLFLEEILDDDSSK